MSVDLDDVLQSAPDLGDDSTLPAHTRIEQWLTGVIDTGIVVPGDKLPREETLAAALGVSRMTLRQALAALQRHGTIVRKPGRLGRGWSTTDPVTHSPNTLTETDVRAWTPRRAARRRRSTPDRVAVAPDVGSARGRPGGRRHSHPRLRHR